MNYGWIISEDLLSEDDETPPSNLNAEGMMGPRDTKLDAATVLSHGEYFEMFDDDNTLYYQGYYYDADGDGDEFAPLDDFGMPNAGCTGIKYRDKETGRMEYL